MKKNFLKVMMEKIDSIIQEDGFLEFAFGVIVGLVLAAFFCIFVS